MAQSVDPEFLSFIRNNLEFFEFLIDEAVASRFSTLEARYDGLWKAIRYGLDYEPVASRAARMIVTTFPLVERVGFWSQWLPLINKALISAANDKVLSIKLYNCRGVLLRLTSSLDAAIEAHEIALQKAYQQPDSVLRAESHLHLGNAYLKCNNLGRATKQAEKAFALLEPCPKDNSALQASLYNLMGSALLQLGDILQAVGVYKKAVALWQKNDSSDQLTKSMANIGVAYSQMAQFDKALLWYDKALVALENTKNRKDRISIQLNQSTLHIRLGDLENAELILRQAEDAINKDIITTALSAKILTNLGCVISEQGRLREARNYLLRAKGAWKKTNDTVELYNVLGELGKLFEREGDLNTAKGYYLSAIQSLAPHVDDLRGRQVLAEISAAYEQLMARIG